MERNTRNIKGCSAVLLWADPKHLGDPSSIVACPVQDITSAKPNLELFMTPQERLKYWSFTFKEKDGIFPMRVFARIEKGETGL